MYDGLLIFKPKHTFWDPGVHEPLIIGFTSPLLPHAGKYSKWKLKRTALAEQTASKVYRIQSSSRQVDGHILSKLLEEATSIPSMPDGMTRELFQYQYL